MHTPFRPHPPVVIGLIGGIAAGKSAVADAFAAHGLAVLDADKIAREVVESRKVAAEIRAAFGDGVFTSPPSTDRQPDPGRPPSDRPVLDRKAMAAIAFSDPTARRTLEGITHPAIRAELLALLAAHRTAGASVILDAPLLLEGGLDRLCDRVVFVAADHSTRRARAATRGWDAAELDRREANQTPLTVKSQRADATVHNDGTLTETQSQVAALLDQWR